MRFIKYRSRMMMWYLARLLILPVVAGFSNIGTNFYVAFPPNHSGSQSGTCTLYFNALQQTQVSILTTRTGILESFHLSPLVTYTHFVDCAGRVPLGIDNYSIRIVATDPVSIQLYTYSSYGDMITLFPEIEDTYSSYDYYLHTLDERSSCSSSAYDPMFTLASYYDDINVTIYDSPVGGENMTSFTMGAFRTYLDYRRCNENHDFTGWRVHSSSPLSVTTGSLYSLPEYSSSTTYLDQALFRVLDNRMLDTEYVVPPIEWPSDPSTSVNFFVRIISFSDDNLIAIIDHLNAPILAKMMTQNEVFEYRVPNGNSAHIVRCADKCDVIAFPTRVSNSNSGALLFHLPSSQRGTQRAVFNRIHSTSLLTIVANTRSVYFNGEIITANWKDMVDNNLYYTSISLTSSGAQVVTVPDEGASFQCYIHGRISNYEWSGDVVGVGEMPLSTASDYVIPDERMESIRKEAPIGL